MEAIKTQIGRSIKVGYGVTEEFYSVNMSGGDILLWKNGSHKSATRQIVDVNGYMGFKFKGNHYQLDMKTVVIQPRPTKRVK